jgi:hypothetical protein
MADYYVRESTAHSGTRDGTTYALAWGTFSEVDWGTGVGQLDAGDTLWVCGTHTEILTFNRSGTSFSDMIIVDGDADSAPDVNAAGDYGSINITGVENGINAYQNYIKIRNLTIENTSASAITKKGIGSGNTYGIILENLIVRDFDQGLIRGSTTALTQLDATITATNCIFENAVNTGFFMYFHADNGVAKDVTLTDCTFRNNGSIGCSITCGGLDGTPKNSITDGLFIDNCEFSGNGGAGLAVTCSQSENTDITDARRPRNVQITNCVMKDNVKVGFDMIGLHYDPDAGIPRSRVANCVLDNNSTNGSAGSMENIGCDGLIVEDNYITNGHSDGTFDGCGMWIDLNFNATNPLVATLCIYRRNIVINHTDYWNATTNTSVYMWSLPPNGESAPSSGMRILGATDCEVYNNIFINQNSGIALTTHPTAEPERNLIYNNTFIDNHGVGIWVKNLTNTTNVIKNNIFANFNVDEVETYEGYSNDAAAQQTFSDNLFHGFVDGPHKYNAAGPTPTGAMILTDNIRVDPLLGDNSFPSLDSPAINAGVTTLSNFDAYGRPNTGNHIGAVWPPIETNKKRRKL